MAIKVTTETITRKIYSDIEVDGEKYILIDMLNENGRVIDSVLRNENGYDIDDPVIMEAVEEIVDKL